MEIGNAPYLYDVIHDFAKLPRNMQLGYTHGIVVDESDNLFVFNQSPTAMIELNKHGEFIRSWGEEFAKGAHGLYLSHEHNDQYLYLVDYELHQVVKMTRRGDERMRIGLPPRPDIYAGPSEYRPTDVCIAPDGTIYVFDGYGKPYIHLFDPLGKYLSSIGGPGDGPGQLNCPHGGWIDTRSAVPELYVADRGNNRIQVFTLDGHHKRFIRSPEIKQPCDFYQWGNDLYIPDLQARLVILDRNDQVTAVLGDNPEAPKTPGWPNIQDKLIDGKFNSPHACCVDSRGNIYVVEWISTGRITKLVRKTEPLIEQEPRIVRMT